MKRLNFKVFVNFYIVFFLLHIVTLKALAKIEFNIKVVRSSVKVNPVVINEKTFLKVMLPEFDSSRVVGAPELPIKQWLVVGTPDNLKVTVNVNRSTKIKGIPTPVQEQTCRCSTDKVQSFQYNLALYNDNQNPVTVNYLGTFRNQPISQVTVRVAKYEASSESIVVATSANITINSDEFSLDTNDYKNYLILGPENLLSGITEFKSWKESLGYNVFTEAITSPNNTKEAIQSLIKSYYLNHKVDFAIILGDETTTPMFQLSTSGSSLTPSDLKYFTMDGDDDYIPDVFGSRIVASAPEDVKKILGKSIAFERSTSKPLAGFEKLIGIASNEGTNPSDNEYVSSIESKFKDTLSNSQIVHLYQDNADSNPTFLNSELSSGAGWMIYIGHGSGKSWPSFNKEYTTEFIKKINNKDVSKPIIIDVACQNGRLIEDQLGTVFMKEQKYLFNNANGAVAYYGGTVNISWNPPAIMAQGIFFEHLLKNFNHLGEALLAGQLHLAAQWDDATQVTDNFEWYHLQGDPGLRIKY